jgi:hypothetical protein
MARWTGVDLDGTLAYYEDGMGASLGNIGEPIWPMVERVRGWLEAGREVRVVTARMSFPEEEGGGRHQIPLIHSWLINRAGLPALPVQGHKDYEMDELWDDRAVRVITNTGLRAEDVSYEAGIAQGRRY